MPSSTDPDIVARLTSSAPRCRLWPEQTQGPYHRDVHPERRDITEGLPGLPLRVGLRLLDSGALPLTGILVEIWQADDDGRYSGFGPFVAVPGQVVTSDSVPDEVVAPRESFLRGAQRTDGDGICVFRTIFPGWYSSRTAHIHVIAHLAEHNATTQLYFPDEVTEEVFSYAPYRDRPRRDTTNATDSIFADGGEQTVVDLDGDPATSLTATLCVSIEDPAG